LLFAVAAPLALDLLAHTRSMSQSSGRPSPIPLLCSCSHVRGPSGGFCRDGSLRSWRSTARPSCLSPGICRLERGIRRASSRRNRGESPPWADPTVPVAQRKALVNPQF
jgi:hypothetical protein